MGSLISEIQRQAIADATKRKEELVLHASMAVFDDVKCMDDLLANANGYTDSHGYEHYQYKGIEFLIIAPPRYSVVDNQFTASFQYKVIE